MAQQYRLWHDGKVFDLILDAEPRDGDIINDDEVNYTVAGRRFVDGKLHYVVKGSGNPRSMLAG